MESRASSLRFWEKSSMQHSKARWMLTWITKSDLGEIAGRLYEQTGSNGYGRSNVTYTSRLRFAIRTRVYQKRERILADSVSDRIIGLYALDNITLEISNWMEENLCKRVSVDTISSIIDRILPELQSRRSRSLDLVYPIVWMNAVHYKVMDERNRLVTRVIYNL